MRVHWNPSEKTIAKMKKINDLKKSGKTYDEIAKIIGNHFTAIIAFNKYYEAHFNRTS